jgi:CelD/BcsL family acetyltransferase involved in cellulose biosynthesis
MRDFCSQADQEGATFMVAGLGEPAAETDPADLPDGQPTLAAARALQDDEPPKQPSNAAANAEAIWLRCWFAAYAGNDPAGMEGLQLQQQRIGFSAFSLNLLHSPTNLQTPRFQAAPQIVRDHARLQRALQRHRAAGLVLEYLPQGDIAALSSSLQLAGLRYLAMPSAAVPITDCSQSFDHFVQRRSKRERQRSRRLLRMAEGEDSLLRFSVITGHDQAGTLLEQCFSLEQASWKGREKTAILDKAEDARFYRALAQELASAGLLRLAVLHDRDGRLLAFELCILWDRRLIALKTSCSEHHLDLSPGHVLALLHIRHCCADQGIDIYDVTGNGLNPAAHLLRYADRQELLWRVVVFSPGWRGRLLRLLWQARLHLRSVKRFVARQRR